MKLSREDYNRAVGYLKRYHYNCINIINIRADIMSISTPQNDGMPKPPYSISDTVYNQYIKLQEDKELQKSLKEYKVVINALQLVSKESQYIFEKEYREGKYRWDIIEKLGTSEETYKRRKRELIYAVDGEIKKLT